LFLFSSDICGEGRVPRHARQYGDIASLQAQIRDERVRALTAFRSDVTGGCFPNETETVAAPAEEFATFIASIDQA